MYACLTWRPFIFGQETEVFTDHRPLLAYKSFKSVLSRLTRLALQLADFDLKILYKKGSQMTEADFLSRQENSDAMDPNILEETMNMILQVDLTQLQNELEDLKKIINTLNGSSTATKKDPLAEDFIMKYNILDRRL